MVRDQKLLRKPSERSPEGDYLKFNIVSGSLGYIAEPKN